MKARRGRAGLRIVPERPKTIALGIIRMQLVRERPKIIVQGTIRMLLRDPEHRRIALVRQKTDLAEKFRVREHLKTGLVHSRIRHHSLVRRRINRVQDGPTNRLAQEDRRTLRVNRRTIVERSREITGKSRGQVTGQNKILLKARLRTRSPNAAARRRRQTQGPSSLRDRQKIGRKQRRKETQIAQRPPHGSNNPRRRLANNRIHHRTRTVRKQGPRTGLRTVTRTFLVRRRGHRSRRLRAVRIARKNSNSEGTTKTIRIRTRTTRTNRRSFTRDGSISLLKRPVRKQTGLLFW